jgi:pyruvyl transferase EpsI
MISAIKKIIPLSWKAKMILFSNQFKLNSEIPFKIPNPKKRRIFIFLAADYGNLGDVAITYAQHKFLNNFFSDCIITEIPISKTLEGIVFVKRIINPNDLITTVGGGNMGDLYDSIELYRRLIISNFHGNKIISFPQTIDFSETPKGNAALKKAIKIYSKHPNLLLLAREQKSFTFFKKHFKKNKTLMVPDIVLTLDKTKPQVKRSGAIVCLRHDKEKKLSSTQENQLLQLIKVDFKTSKTRDTHIGGENLSLRKRVKALHAIWDDFKTAELVITDRLHGMIFCYITNTPAIVFLNNNHKIQSSFHWIKTAKHIHLMDNFSEENIQESITLLKKNTDQGHKENLLPYYDDFLKSVKSN